MTMLNTGVSSLVRAAARLHVTDPAAGRQTQALVDRVLVLATEPDEPTSIQIPQALDLYVQAVLGAVKACTVTADDVRSRFYWGSFELWAACLLDGGSTRVLEALAFRFAPSLALLQALTSYLSQVSPLGEGPFNAGPSVFAPGSVQAAALLAGRFAAGDSSCGIGEILLLLAAYGSRQQQQRPEEEEPPVQVDSAAAFSSSRGTLPALAASAEQALSMLFLLPVPPPCATATGTATATSSNSSASAVPSHGLDPGAIGPKGLDPDDLAALLVSVPDRSAVAVALPSDPGAGQADLAALEAEAFYHHLLSSLVAALRDPGACTRAALAALAQRRRTLLASATAAGATAGAEAAGNGTAAEAACGHDLQQQCQLADGGADGQQQDAVDGVGPGSDLLGCHALHLLVQHAAAQLLAALLARLCKRGTAGIAADVLLRATPQFASFPCAGAIGTSEPAGSSAGSGGAGASTEVTVSLQGCCNEVLLRLLKASPQAFEKLLVALLDRAAAALAAGSSTAAGGTAGGGAGATQGGDNGLAAAPLTVVQCAMGAGALAWLLPPALVQEPEAAYLVTDKLLLQRTLPCDCLQLLVALLPLALPADSAAQRAAAAAAVARVWADPSTVTRTAVQHQAYMTNALLLLLQPLDKARLEAAPGLLGSLVSGVGARLGSALPPTQRQAMRVGRTFSRILDPASDLFSDMGDLRLGGDELWPGALPRRRLPPPAPPTASPPAASHDATRPVTNAAASSPSHAVNVSATSNLPCEEVSATHGADAGSEGGEGDARSVRTATDSDDEDEEDDEPLQPLDLEEDLEAEAWKRAEPSKLQLRALAAALRKQDDVSGVLEALKKLELVVRAAPDELGLLAPELVRSLLHCRVPEWADAQATSPEEQPDQQRQRSLVALLAVAPVPAGDALIPEVYSPHLDTHQRLTLLAALALAAQELALPTHAPRLALYGPAGRPVLERGPRHQHPQLAGTSASRPALGSATGATVRAAKTRVYAPVALRKRQEEEAARGGGGVSGVGASFRNRFGDVALRWAAGLLREVDRTKHGVDLLGRDHLVLGQLVTTLAAFAEAAAGTPALPGLANTTLELLRAPQVHAHAEPYVRRAALLAAGQVLAQLPPARVAAALVAGGGGASAGDALGERLEWLQGWTRSAAASDVDAHVRMMAEACLGLQADLAARALQSLQDGALAGSGGRDPFAPILPAIDLAASARALTAGRAEGAAAAPAGAAGGRFSGLVQDVSVWQ